MRPACSPTWDLAPVALGPRRARAGQRAAQRGAAGHGHRALRLRRAHRDQLLPRDDRRPAPAPRPAGGPLRAVREVRGPDALGLGGAVGTLLRGHGPRRHARGDPPRAGGPGHAQSTCAPGRQRVLLSPSAAADMLIYLLWSAGARDAVEGRSAFSRPGGGTRVGDRLASLPVWLRSDPAAAGLECADHVQDTVSSARVERLRRGPGPGRDRLGRRWDPARAGHDPALRRPGGPGAHALRRQPPGGCPGALRDPGRPGGPGRRRPARDLPLVHP